MLTGIQAPWELPSARCGTDGAGVRGWGGQGCGGFGAVGDRPQPRGGQGMLTAVLAHLLPDVGSDLLLLPTSGGGTTHIPGEIRIREEEKFTPRLPGDGTPSSISIHQRGTASVPFPLCRGGGPTAPYRHAWLPFLPAEPLGAGTALGGSRAELGAVPGALRGSAGCPLTHLLSSLAGDAGHAASPHHRLPGGAPLPLPRIRDQGAGTRLLVPPTPWFLQG